MVFWGPPPFIHSDVNGGRHVDFAIHFDDAFTMADDNSLRRSDSDDDEFLVIIGHLELPSGAVFSTLLSRCNGYTDVSYPGNWPPARMRNLSLGATLQIQC